MKKIMLSLILLISISQAKEIKIMFADSMSSETSTIQPYTNWYIGSDEGKTTLTTMYNEGWRLIEVVKLNAVASSRQFWLYLERGE